MKAPTKKPKKAAPKKRPRERKREVIAAGLIAGKKMTAIAAAAGTQERNAYRIAAQPETQLLITKMFDPHRQRLRNMVVRAIRVVQEGFEAKHYVRTGKERWSLRIDHFARLRAVERFGDLLQLAQGKPPDASIPDAEIGRSYTWEEFILLQARRVVTSAATTANAGNPQVG
jgi:hypothetical protein